MNIKIQFFFLATIFVGEYLDMEFMPSGGAKFDYDLDRVIDDFILFCVLVGNDFLPSLPYAEISESGLDDLFRVYKDHLVSASSSPWLTKNCGEVDFKQTLSRKINAINDMEYSRTIVPKASQGVQKPQLFFFFKLHSFIPFLFTRNLRFNEPRLQKFMKKYGELEDGHLQSACDEQEFLLGKQRLVGPEDAPAPKEYTPDLLMEPPPTSDLAREQWYEVKFGMDLTKYEGTQKLRLL